MSVAAAEAQSSAAAGPRNATTESALVRWILIATGMLFIAVVLVLPLISVFMEALRGGLVTF
ncbi:MAG TPA: sulfate/thiosulfate ABC transporter permease CysW, partial [Dongiaceae bacterium]